VATRGANITRAGWFHGIRGQSKVLPVNRMRSYPPLVPVPVLPPPLLEISAALVKIPFPILEIHERKLVKAKNG